MSEKSHERVFHIYCLSGLAEDSRIFHNLRIRNAELHFIDWILPEPGDTMRSYAIRLSTQVKHEEVILAGVSFGGMLASEINRVYQETADDNGKSNVLPFRILKTILISSCKHPGEFPRMLKFAGKVNFHKFVPYRAVQRNDALNRYMFDLKSLEEEMYMKRLMLKSQSAELLRRSLRIILKWKAPVPHGILHIHGTRDGLISAKNVRADHWIEGGGHFMVWNRAKEISEIINRVIGELQQKSRS